MLRDLNMGNIKDGLQKVSGMLTWLIFKKAPKVGEILAWLIL
jgi:hypothetical protein